MNNYDFYEYIRRLHLFVEAQDKKIKHLEQIVIKLEEDVNQLKNKPPIHVDKIEYKFDQLKVETLDGTLNIGLNPSDLNKIDDFAVDGQQAVGNQYGPANLFQTTMRLEEQVLQSLDSDVNNIIQQFENENQIKIEENYIAFIKDDIKKQLPQRIQLYLNQIPIDHRHEQNVGEQEMKITNILKNDIQKGIVTFLTNLPHEKKG